MYLLLTIPNTHAGIGDESENLHHTEILQRCGWISVTNDTIAQGTYLTFLLPPIRSFWTTVAASVTDGMHYAACPLESLPPLNCAAVPVGITKARSMLQLSKMQRAQVCCKMAL